MRGQKPATVATFAATLGACIILLGAAGAYAAEVGVGQQPAAPPDEAEQAPPPEAAPAPARSPGAAQPMTTAEGAPIAPGVPQEDRIDIINLDYFKWDQKHKVLLGEGNVKVIVHEPVTEAGVTSYQDVTVTAKSVFIDFDADLAIFQGDVRIEREHVVVTQNELRVNLETKAADASGDIRASLATELFAGPWPLEPLFVEGDEVHVEPEANFMRAQRGMLTSCDLEKPHYFFMAPEVDVTPGKQLRLKRPRLRILGNTIARYPGNLSIPLNRQRSSVIPGFGRNLTEGRFVHFSFPYTSGKEASGAFRLNLTERRGLGIGAEHFVYAEEQGGELFVLWQPQESSFTSRARHTYNFSSSLTTDATGSFQSNSGFARGSTESSDAGLIVRNRDRNSTFELAFRRNETVSSFGGSQRSSLQLRDDQQYGGGLRSNLLFNFRDTGVTGRVADLELNSELEIARRDPDRPFDWRLEAERRFDLDGDSFTQDNNLFILERSPVLTINTSTERFGGGWLRDLPLDAELSLGQFRQRPTGGDIFRSYVGLGLTPRQIELGANSDLNVSTEFRQGFYSDGTAQYVLGAHVGLRNQHGPRWQSDVGYDLTDPHGFTPLRFDSAGIRSTGRWALSRSGGGLQGSRLQLTGGFDFERNRHYDTLLRGRFPLARGTLLDFSTGYSLERSLFRPLIAELERVDPEGLSFGLSARYDLELQQLGRVRGTLDWPVRKWRLEALAGYNGISKELDFADVRLTRDLHCWTASVTYSMQQRSFMLNVGIKAFAVATPALGTGLRGQGFDLEQGSQY